MTTNQSPVTPPADQEAFIPPYYMLILAALGLAVAIFVALTQPSFNVVGWGALGIGVLSLVAWVLMAPDQARAILSGRTARYGGASILVTVIFLGALVAIYALIRDRNIRIDLTERDTFSLTEESRQAISAIGADPTLPNVRILAFYGASQASRRDQDILLFEDYARTSNGKVAFEFIDPDRNPAQATQYEVERPGQVVVVALNADGQPDVENAEKVNFVSQDQLTNAILRVAAQGNFRAYFLNIEGGLKLTETGVDGMSILNDSLTQRFDWTTQQVSLFELTGEQSEIKLNDETADGTVLVIPGGDQSISDAEMEFIASYVNNGGSLVIFAASGVSAVGSGSSATLAQTQPIALSDNMSEFLYTNFGVRFAQDLVVDPTLSLQSPLNVVAVTFSTTNYITRNFQAGQNGMVFTLAHRIEIAPTLPDNVTVTEIALSGDSAYAKSIDAVLQENSIAQTETDPKGPFPLAVAVENLQTGARLALFGSTSVISNGYALGSGIVNLDAAFNSLVWATRFNDFFSTVNIQSLPRPQDTPVFASDAVLRNINLFTVFILPFGVLGIGLLVWWNNRERARQGDR